ncbi:hypothetical protein ACJMK2_009795 [Sinanodonta woodiana]|uniref:Ribosome biogenesis protein BOP1 homolog n=1 Tax=Sinanodonta woodiana TaxID=1069815 RepID=A0ABD3VDC2_SINWO
MATKRKSDIGNGNHVADEVDLFVERAVQGEDKSEDDTTDSEESVYSGLEEEEDTSDSGEDQDSAESDDFKDDDDNLNENEMKDELSKKELDVQNNNRSNSDLSQTTQATVPEYEYDSSDEEDIRNTVGNIPMEWYKNYTHIGYDIDGKKLVKPEKADELDEFLNKMDDPNYWRTVTNKLTGQSVILSKEDVELIQRLQEKKHPSAQNEMYAPWVEVFVNETMIHPLSNRPEHKRSFMPSKWEKLKVGQMVYALKMGWMKPTKTQEDKEADEEKEEENKFYMLWKEDEESEISKRIRQNIPAPKIPLPGHEESYNPPPEYLFTEEEKKKWEEQDEEERRLNFIPQKFNSLREVPAYPRFINERFNRCLDLYLCPRQSKMKMNVNPEDLIPKLPKPKDLQPFPTQQALVYRGHKGMVRCLSADKSGQWLASGSDDGTVKIWEVVTGRCMKTFKIDDVIKGLEWNPNPSLSLVALTVEHSVILINPGVGDKLLVSSTDDMISSFDTSETQTGKISPVEWSVYDGKKYDEGFRIKITHEKEVTQVTWHVKGDYFATVVPKGDSRSVIIHQLSKRRSQNPFSKSKGLVQCVRFHPVRPFLFVASQRYVRVYNLLKQELSKKLMTNCQWVSSIAVHPRGDNLIIGSYDCRLSWFDMDLSTKPYQTLRHHKKALRQVCYHPHYPLFASASDDCTVIVCHGMVYNDLLQNPQIVPVKILRGHTPENGVGILDCVFHPTQPWIFSAGADSTIRLYT